MTPRPELLALLLFAGCRPADLDTGPAAPLHDEAPVLTGTTWSCSREEGQWDFEVTTDRWTANGDLFLAAEDDYLEAHDIQSVEAASDGSTDRLALTLDIVADWREVSSGSSTAFFCTEAVLAAISGRVVVYTPGTGDVGDCWSFGANTAIFNSFGGVPACDALIPAARRAYGGVATGAPAR